MDTTLAFAPDVLGSNNFKCLIHLLINTRIQEIGIHINYDIGRHSFAFEAVTVRGIPPEDW